MDAPNALQEATTEELWEEIKGRVGGAVLIVEKPTKVRSAGETDYLFRYKGTTASGMGMCRLMEAWLAMQVGL